MSPLDQVTLSHPVREAIAHLDDLDLDELAPVDLDTLHAAALSFAQTIEEEWFRRDDDGQAA